MDTTTDTIEAEERYSRCRIMSGLIDSTIDSKEGVHPWAGSCAALAGLVTRMARHDDQGQPGNDEEDSPDHHSPQVNPSCNSHPARRRITSHLDFRDVGSRNGCPQLMPGGKQPDDAVTRYHKGSESYYSAVCLRDSQKAALGNSDSSVWYNGLLDPPSAPDLEHQNRHQQDTEGLPVR